MRLIDANELMEHVWRDRLDSREAIAEMVNNAPTVRNAIWVSVKDRLPPVHFNVLVWCGKDKYHCDQYHIARVDKYGCWYTVDRLGGCDPILWCPLPEPLKEDDAK